MKKIYEAMIGEPIEETALKMVNLCTDIEDIVTTVFNGIELTATYRTPQQDIIDLYYKKREVLRQKESSKDLENRILRLEVLNNLALPPHGWITIDKVRAVRAKLDCSLEDARQYLIKRFGELPDDF